MLNIIDEIIQEMLTELNNSQLIKLRSILVAKLGGSRVDKQKDNEEYLQDYLSAKEVEGCSEKTIAYYKATILMLFDGLQKHINLMVFKSI